MINGILIMNIKKRVIELNSITLFIFYILYLTHYFIFVLIAEPDDAICGRVYDCHVLPPLFEDLNRRLVYLLSLLRLTATEFAFFLSLHSD